MNAFSVTNHVNGTLARMEETRDARPAHHAPVRTVAAAGDTLTRKGLAALAVEHLTGALLRVIELAYEEDTDARLANVDAQDGRLLIPVPWGSAGYKKYGLRRREGEVLRLILFERMTPKAGAPVPLFTYAEERRTWHVNLFDFPSRSAAGDYLRHAGVTVREYKRCLAIAQEADRSRK